MGKALGSATKACRTWRTKPWKNEELKKLEEALPRLKEGELEKYRDCLRQKQK